MHRRYYRFPLLILLILLLSCSMVVAADSDPWYMGKRIASFTNLGLQNVDENVVMDIQYNYIGKTFSEPLFNQLQSELYGLDTFLYFLAEARRTGEGDNELEIAMTFHELPYIELVTIEGNSGVKEKDIREVLLSKEGSFLDDQNIEKSKRQILSLYQEKGYADTTIDSTYTVNDETDRAKITYSIVENKQKRVGQIVFEGNENLSSDLLAKQLDSKQISYFNAGYFNPLTIENDKQKLIAFYQTRGFIDAKIVNMRTEDISREEDAFARLRVVFEIDEGEKWFFGGIKVEGNTVFTDEDFQNLITYKTGSVLDVSRVQKEMTTVTDLYWNNGYIFNLISTDIVRDEQNKTITYVLTVKENQQAFIEDIRIEGLTKTKPYVFERELTFAKGDIFSKEKLIRSAQNIYNTLIVTDVQFDIINGNTEGGVIPVFSVVEGNQMDIQFGATFGGNVDGFPVSGFLQWSDKNLAGTGRDLAISTNLSPDTQNITVSFSDGWVGNRRWSNGLSFSFERSVKDSALQRGEGSPYYSGHDDENAYPLGYDSYASFVAANQALPQSSYLMTYTYYRLSLGYDTGYTFMFQPGALIVGGGITIGLNYASYDKNIYDPYEKLIKLYGDNWQFSNRISLNFAWDGRDRIENTSRGYYVSQSFTYAGGILGGLSNYIRTSTSASAYTTLFSYNLEDRPANVVLGVTSSVSVMLPQYYNPDNSGWKWYDAKQGATRYEMLYIDGMNVGRGFSVVFDQEYLWDNQISISWPLAQNVLSAELYASATGVSKDWKQAKPNQLGWYYSMGAGVKLKVPGFPLGLYLVKNATYINNQFNWVGGNIFKGNSENSGLELVLAITTTLY